MLAFRSSRKGKSGKVLFYKHFVPTAHLCTSLEWRKCLMVLEVGHCTSSARSNQPPRDDHPHSSDHSQALFQTRAGRFSFRSHKSALVGRDRENRSVHD